MRTCGNCGALLDDKVKKCPECGKKVCVNCGNVLGTGVTKCPKCGEATTLGSLQSCSCLMAIGFAIAFIILLFLIGIL